MLLAGGAAEALLFLLLAALMPLLLAAYRSPATRRSLAWGVGGALLFGAAWLAFLATQHIPLMRAFNLQRWLGSDSLRPGDYPGILGWYAWPAWPLAAWAVYRERRQWRTPGMVLPVGALAGLLGLYAMAADPDEEQGLILLLPLALLAPTDCSRCGVGAANALLWFGGHAVRFIGLMFSSTGRADLGCPARLAVRLGKLGMTHVGDCVHGPGGGIGRYPGPGSSFWRAFSVRRCGHAAWTAG